MFTTLFKAFYHPILEKVEIVDEINGDQFFLAEAEKAGWTFVGCFIDQSLAKLRAEEALCNFLDLDVDVEEDFWNSNAFQKAMFEYECGGYED